MHTAILFLFTVLLSAGEPSFFANAPLVPLSAITDKEIVREVSQTYPPEVLKRLQFYAWNVSETKTIEIRNRPNTKTLYINIMKSNPISDGLDDIPAYAHLEYSSNILDGFSPVKTNSMVFLAKTITFKVKTEKVFGTIYIPTVVN